MLVRRIASRPLTRAPYVCPSCLLRQHAQHLSSWARATTSSRDRDAIKRTSILTHTALYAGRSQHSHTLKLQHAVRGRSYTDLASNTAVHAPSTVPSNLRQLHHDLTQLQDKSSSFINLSQIQLAIRSLERAEPVTRIAFLGLGAEGQYAARQLARVLLGDALEDEQPWETALRLSDDGGSILLRYGIFTDDSGVQYNASMIKTMSLPSPFLQKHNVEILITRLNSNGLAFENNEELKETILVPTLTIPGAGRVGFVRHPVHNALIVGEGISGAIGFGRLPKGLVDGLQISSAISLPLRPASETVNPEAQSTSNSIDIDLASHSLQLFRQDKANGAIFSKEWQTSRVSDILSWIKKVSDISNDASGLKSSTAGLLHTVFANVERSVHNAESLAQLSTSALAIPETKRKSLRKTVTAWSEEAHIDLQHNLDIALASEPWRKTAWWRLFWRIDEVSISASDVVVRGWLVEAEQTLAFLSGRLLEAGLATEAELKGEVRQDGTTTDLLTPMLRNDVKELKAEAKQPSRDGTVGQFLQISPMLSRIQQESGLNVLFDPPWPQTINVARQQMLHQLVPAFHRKAQALLFATLSLAGTSAGIAGTLFAASGGVALYEAGAIAALGLVWSLRRLQGKWGKERAAFAQTVRENGRSVLLDVERRLAALVQHGGRTRLDENAKSEWNDARRTVQACRETIKRLGQSP